jgi:hypothetical protein
VLAKEKDKMKAEIRNEKSEIERRGRRSVGAVVGLAAMLVAALMAIGALSGCSTLDRAYKQQVTWTNAPVVGVVTNTVVVTNMVPVVLERTNVLYVTNAASGAVAGYAVREPVATNMVAAVVTNFVPVFYTNLVEVPVTNVVSNPVAEASISAAGSLVNLFAPGLGSVIALVLGGLYHGYRQLRNRRVNEALVQGVETARAVLTTTPQGQAADAQFVRWLMAHQKEAGVFATVSDLVDQVSDNPAARMTAQEIAKRAQQAQQQRQAGQAMAAAN